MLKTILAALLSAVIFIACATAPSVITQADYATRLTSAYVEMTTISLQRGRISPFQAEFNLQKAKRVEAELKKAETILKGCPPPCTAYTDLLKALQPSLYELERELRAAEVAK